MKVISIAAQLMSGKDEFCDYLAKVLNDERLIWHRSAFANAVKDTYCHAFGVNRDFIERWKRINECPPGMLMPVRQQLQFIGDGFRKIKDEIWIEIALRGDKDLIISDSRYINEARSVCAKKGLMFLMYRPGFLNDDPNPSEAQIRPLVDFCIEHLKEGPIDFNKLKEEHGEFCPDALQYYHYWLVNDKTLSDFRSKIARDIVPYVDDYFRKFHQ